MQLAFDNQLELKFLSPQAVLVRSENFMTTIKWIASKILQNLSRIWEVRTLNPGVDHGTSMCIIFFEENIWN